MSTLILIFLVFVFEYEPVRDTETDRQTDVRSRRVTWPTGRPHNKIKKTNKVSANIKSVEKMIIAVGCDITRREQLDIIDTVSV